MAEQKTSGCAGVAAVFLLGFLAWAIAVMYQKEDRQQTEKLYKATPLKSSYLKLMDGFEWENDFLTGIVTNQSAEVFDKVYIEFQLFDKDGAQTGMANDFLTDLNPHGMWRFKCYARGAAKVKLKELKGQ